MSAQLKASVRAMLGGNLWIDETELGLRTEDAIMYIAAAQLKAVALALQMTDPPGDDSTGWVQKEAFTKNEAVAAIGGVATLLGQARTLLRETEDCESAESGTHRVGEAAE